MGDGPWGEEADGAIVGGRQTTDNKQYMKEKKQTRFLENTIRYTVVLRLWSVVYRPWSIPPRPLTSPPSASAPG